MAAGIRKRSVVIEGHATSVSLEAEFWEALTAIARRRGVTVNQLVAEIDSSRQGNLSSAIRIFVLREAQARNEQGTAR
ncbi:ribbon-helix-helix domain-containing protein [Desertibaculum subflavum]|uniref:ribbon-helix-helix domain-containing protein n=1 Tax=Desertibaculum subflavum TaxID=2268458 RepID=UPI0034D37F14